MNNETTCGHTGCNCPTIADSLYCCEFCQEANSNDATPGDPCTCGCETCTTV